VSTVSPVGGWSESRSGDSALPSGWSGRRLGMVCSGYWIGPEVVVKGPPPLLMQGTMAYNEEALAGFCGPFGWHDLVKRCVHLGPSVKA